MDAGWLAQSFQPPTQTIMVPDSVPKPSPKPQPTKLSATMTGLRTDQELADFINSSKGGTAVIEYGTSWCQKCHEMFPQFYKLSKQYSQHKYAVAQTETMRNIVSSIKYTPTFTIYRNGKRVDEVIGREPQRLEDHLWLHTD
eukprot:GHUV01013419.1.p1 GENE.GHUV01013419.1~~GHUV01013419.1.p1  ORF type:complete len:142 (+),score=32.24 GHUV01013419.1:800-1225(+)